MDKRNVGLKWVSEGYLRLHSTGFQKVTRVNKEEAHYSNLYSECHIWLQQDQWLL